ncbi:MULTISPECIES: uracil-xanthine permease family protein [Micrococcaceae]|uniref:uracil-xanthine permease family protein n=1 Tax=Micrococcaceae TaxID=1268 RepID=UPI000CFCF9E9|nr:MULTISPECIES: solute carrier family 23 protein [unclassified Arthrobacter]MCS3493946.1 NCS2 family nucleobase:cation symporter-2 [Arthrobacter sp. JUb119]PQZ85349.1 nitrate reductase [Arthrobacter sp. MYb222]PRB75073.1 nitrate reductase [Arthrobacter sp. MYb214]
MSWSIHGNGRTITPGEVVAPDERLHWPQTVSIGAQHILAMFGASILVPTITGFPVTTTLLFTGLATVIFLLMTRNKVPSYLGSSFAMIAPVLSTTQSHSMSGALGGIVMTGALLFVVGLIVQKTGTGWIHALMPPVVMGTIVALIGLNLASATLVPMTEFPLTTFLTVIFTVVATVAFKGLLGRLSILMGLLCGYLVALAQGQVSFKAVAAAEWIGLPEFHTPTFHFDTALMFLPAVFVLIAENIGHVRTVGVMTNRDLSKFNGRALMADGAASVLAGFGGGSATTTYAENIGVMAASRVYSTAAYWIAAIVAVALAFLPKFGALIGTIPEGVIGGLGIVLYGMIGIVGARLWIEAKVDFGNPINLMTAGTGLIIAIAVTKEIAFGQLQLGGIALGSIATLVVFHLMSIVAKMRGNDLADSQKPADS